MATKAPAKNEQREPIGRADLVVNAAGQTVEAPKVKAVEVGYPEFDKGGAEVPRGFAVDAFGDARSITVGIDGTYYKLEAETALYLAGLLKSLSTNLNV